MIDCWAEKKEQKLQKGDRREKEEASRQEGTEKRKSYPFLQNRLALDRKNAPFKPLVSLALRRREQIGGSPGISRAALIFGGLLFSSADRLL